MIYIVCPANKATGGPELLHQLGYKLNMFGFPATMLYLNIAPGTSPVCDSYCSYQVPWTEKMTHLRQEDMIVLPEINIPLARQLEGYRCIIWWLSVNNAVYSKEDLAYMQQNEKILHFAQSYYAIDFLHNRLHIPKERTFYLSDYLKSDFFTHLNTNNSAERENIVLFNPKKGFDKTMQLISQSDYRIKWQALNGLTPYGMRETLKQAKIYIDFGTHPGKDRIPREAAMCGCLVLTNREGSAAYTDDVPIPEEYKFSNGDSAGYVLSKIYNFLEEYALRKDDYSDYRQTIQGEYIRFEKDVFVIFSQLTESELDTHKNSEYYFSAMLDSTERGDYSDALKHLVLYRLRELPESTDIFIIEATIRLALGEYGEAKLCIDKGLCMASDNYELHFCAAQLYFYLGEFSLMQEHCEKAVLFSKNTNDESTIQNACEHLLINIKNTEGNAP